jgi:alkanesulfonate monooxygenase SsuD/methylene tetrahydromethanopterin reductase-like flavin-dependent oxidoreductase (luciferase family)
MEFGIQFFPDVGPAEKSGQAYWADALALVAHCDELGYSHVRTVEHYFNAYGGYSPNPIVFLAAAAMRSAKARLVTGAVLPVFNNPLKLAGEIGMLDAISGGRLEVGFARAFLPHEFARFGVSVNESRARFDEGMAQVRLLLSEENVSAAGRFHSFKNVTSLPRPTQRPHPPFWVAALASPESFSGAGTAGHFLMAIPYQGAKMRELVGIYRDAWRAAGNPGHGRVMLALHMFCAETMEEAVRVAREPLNAYLKSVVAAASEWAEGLNSNDYPNYDKIVAALAQETFDTQMAKGIAWIGTPGEIAQRILALNEEVGGFEIASLQVNFHTISREDALRSMRLFAREVMPAVRGRLQAA